MGKILDCAVIGGGPGGLTAALYLKRFRRKILVVNAGKPRAAWIPKTKNLIGYEGGISGAALINRMRAQLKEVGIKVLEGSAKVSRLKDRFLVNVDGKRFETKTVILATGIADNQLKLKNLNRLRKIGLLRYCPVCDGFEHRRKKIFLFVNEEDCLEKVLFLLHYTRQLTVIAPPCFKVSPARKAKYRELQVKIIKGTVEGIEKTSLGLKIRDG